MVRDGCFVSRWDLTPDPAFKLAEKAKKTLQITCRRHHAVAARLADAICEVRPNRAGTTKDGMAPSCAAVRKHSR